ncbi:MAG: hypothetical protein LKKZDAJK_001823 [Candidatus Fervidibacter sp.]
MVKVTVLQSCHIFGNGETKDTRRGAQKVRLWWEGEALAEPRKSASREMGRSGKKFDRR